MKNKNKYGFYSGGYIFDQIDRFALSELNKNYPETKEEYWFTDGATIHYLKQLCDTSNTKLVNGAITKSVNTAHVYVELRRFDTVIACANVGFKLASNNYCETNQ